MVYPKSKGQTWPFWINCLLYRFYIFVFLIPWIFFFHFVVLTQSLGFTPRFLCSTTRNTGPSPSFLTGVEETCGALPKGLRKSEHGGSSLRRGHDSTPSSTPWPSPYSSSWLSTLLFLFRVSRPFRPSSCHHQDEKRCRDGVPTTGQGVTVVLFVVGPGEGNREEKDSDYSMSSGRDGN